MTERRGNGEGSVYKRSDGRWCAIVSVGRGKRKFLYGETRVEVRQKLQAALRDQAAGLPVADDRLTVATYLDGWLKTVAGSVRPNTFISYQHVVNAYVIPELGQIQLSKLSPAHVEALLRSDRASARSATTRAYLRSVLRIALQRAVKYGLVHRNVASLVDAPLIDRRRIEPLTEEQARLLIESTKADRLHAFYVTALMTGCRLGELLGLQWQDVELEKNGGLLTIRKQLQRSGGQLRLVEPKTASSRRSVALASAAARALRSHRELSAVLPLPNAFVFASAEGKPLDPRNVLRSFQSALHRAGLPKRRLHDLRHSCATLLLSEGVHPRVVADLLGHSSTRVTLDTYSHVTKRLQGDAVRHLDRLLGATDAALGN